MRAFSLLAFGDPLGRGLDLAISLPRGVVNVTVLEFKVCASANILSRLGVDSEVPYRLLWSSAFLSWASLTSYLASLFFRWSGA